MQRSVNAQGDIICRGRDVIRLLRVTFKGYEALVLASVESASGLRVLGDYLHKVVKFDRREEMQFISCFGI